MLDFTSMNTEQLKAVMHREGNLLVLAGPGSGKTTVLLQRLRYQIEDCKEPPEGFLVITFTKAAAQSMERRFLSLISPEQYSVTFSTFHAFFYQILKRHTGIGPESFLSETEKQNLLIPILKQFHNQESPTEWLERFARFQNNLKEPLCADFFMEIYTAYQKKVKQLNKTDYDDMANRCLELFARHPKVLAQWQKRYRHILIDEFQDINPCQYEVIRAMAGKKQSVFAVGDDDQAIYGFRGSSPAFMQAFLQDFKPAAQIVLNQNYRSNQSIVAGSRKVIEENTLRIPKALISTARMTASGGETEALRLYGFEKAVEEYDFLAKKIEEYQRAECQSTECRSKGETEQIAVIVRTNAAAAEITRQLCKRRIPCYRKEQKKPLAEHFVFQDILAYLRFAAGSRERSSFLRICNKPERGIGREALDSSQVNLVKLCDYYLVEEGERQIRENIMGLQADLEKLQALPPFLAVNYIRKKIGYDRYLQRAAAEKGVEEKEYLQIADRILDYSKKYTDMSEFMERIQKEWSKEETAVTEEGQNVRVVVMTMHMSKGLEFDRVLLPDCNEGMIPKGKNLEPSELEEERRLFYVAMTRAKKTLDILYLTGTKQYPRRPSCFLKPLF